MDNVNSTPYSFVSFGRDTDDSCFSQSYPVVKTSQPVVSMPANNTQAKIESFVVGGKLYIGASKSDQKVHTQIGTSMDVFEAWEIVKFVAKLLGILTDVTIKTGMHGAINKTYTVFTNSLADHYRSVGCANMSNWTIEHWQEHKISDIMKHIQTKLSAPTQSIFSQANEAEQKEMIEALLDSIQKNNLNEVKKLLRLGVPVDLELDRCSEKLLEDRYSTVDASKWNGYEGYQSMTGVTYKSCRFRATPFGIAYFYKHNEIARVLYDANENRTAGREIGVFRNAVKPSDPRISSVLRIAETLDGFEHVLQNV